MAQRATSLGPKPSFFCFFLVFLSLFLIEKIVFSPQKGSFLFIIECLLLFLLSLFWTTPFSRPLSLSLSLSLFLSLSLSLVFFSLPSGLFLFAFFWFIFISFDY